MNCRFFWCFLTYLLLVHKSIIWDAASYEGKTLISLFWNILKNYISNYKLKAQNKAVTSLSIMEICKFMYHGKPGKINRINQLLLNHSLSCLGVLWFKLLFFESLKVLLSPWCPRAPRFSHLIVNHHTISDGVVSNYNFGA